ncbi:Dps family protein, partial [Herbiconiux daphne]
LPPKKMTPIVFTHVAEKPEEPKDTSTAKFTLQDLVANLELLYVKAKNFHWNVTGPNFIGLHETFDGVQEVALEWADLIAERMRALDIKVDSRMSTYIKQAWFPEAREEMMQFEMIKDMVLTLDCISAYLYKAIDKHTFDPVTENKLQDLCHEIAKQNYFVKSNSTVLSSSL